MWRRGRRLNFASGKGDLSQPRERFFLGIPVPAEVWDVVEYPMMALVLGVAGIVKQKQKHKA